MGWFRRKPSGKHALGAAVTSIPSGPLMLAVSGPTAAPPAPVLVPPPGPVIAPVTHASAIEPDLMTSITELLATGEAGAVTSPVALAATSQTSARSSLQAAMVQLLPPRGDEPETPAGPPVEAPAAARVQLGFRDGTSTTLEPGSSQALALEQLAQSLSRRE